MSGDFSYTFPVPPAPEPEPPFDAEASRARYQTQALKLLPPGRAIAKTLTSGIGLIFGALGVELARVHELARMLRVESVPARANELVGDWESALELDGTGMTTSARLGAVVAAVLGRTSHARPAYDAAAEALGFTIVSVTSHAPFSVGSSGVGSALYGDEWSSQITITVSGGLVSDQPALVAAFERLRRSHGHIDVVFT